MEKELLEAMKNLTIAINDLNFTQSQSTLPTYQPDYAKVLNDIDEKLGKILEAMPITSK
jgi:protoporphyrinogen oxidase